MRKIAGYLTKNRSEKDQKIAQSTHENRYIKPRKTFWRNSKQLLKSFDLIGQKLASGRLQGICGSYAEYIDPMYMDEVIKCMRFQKIENICEAYDIKYEPGISGEEICAGIYLYLLSQDYRQIQNIKFFASPYVALEFYMQSIQPNNDITVFYDIGIFDD